jgi:hypothetical protein
MENTAEMISLGSQIKDKLAELSNSDGLKRTQRWLAMQIGIGEVELSNKISQVSKATFTQKEIEDINSILGTNFKLSA